jgi:hypothetical protein
MAYEAGRTTAFAVLSTPMRLTLIDIVYRGGLLCINGSYDGTRVHARATIIALEKRGLCSIKPKAGAADPTQSGIKIILDEFRGAKPSLADCDSLGRLLPAAKHIRLSGNWGKDT